MVRAIFSTALAQSKPGLMTVNVPAYNTEAMDLVLSLGGIALPTCLRMYMGDIGPAEMPPGHLGIGCGGEGLGGGVPLI